MWIEVSFGSGWVKISYEHLRHKETESIFLTPEIERVFTSISTNSRNEFSSSNQIENKLYISKTTPVGLHVTWWSFYKECVYKRLKKWGIIPNNLKLFILIFKSSKNTSPIQINCTLYQRTTWPKPINQLDHITVIVINVKAAKSINKNMIDISWEESRIEATKEMVAFPHKGQLQQTIQRRLLKLLQCCLMLLYLCLKVKCLSLKQLKTKNFINPRMTKKLTLLSWIPIASLIMMIPWSINFML